MDTIYNRLEKLYNGKGNGLANRSRVKGSIGELLANGKARTGFSNRRGKTVWTYYVVDFLTRNGFKCEAGNDAPRGGACGEYVVITSPAFNKEVKRRMTEKKRIMEEEEARIKAEREAYENTRNAMSAWFDTHPAAQELFNEIFRGIADESLHGELRRRNRKHARHAAAAAVAEKFGVDYKNILTVR